MIHGKFKRSSSVPDITWFSDLYDSGKLNLEPPYQRRSVWTRKDKIFFLDTVFKGYPCPAVYLHKTLDDKGKSTYHVIDGKQRLETVLHFMENRLTLPKDFDNGNPELANKKWKDIDIDYKRLFWNYSIPMDQFDVVEISIIDEMFDRLNRNSRKLEPQELRHARYDGWFITYAENLSEHSIKLKELKVVTAGRIKRMKEVQFISELMMIILNNDIMGFSQITIDQYYADYDDPEEELDFSISDFEEKFNSTIEYIYEMNKINNCVLDCATTVVQFYTLFAIIALQKERDKEKLKDIKDIADKYKNFIETYKDHAANNTSADEGIIEYTKASTGASTEEPLRRIRLEKLNNYLFNE